MSWVEGESEGDTKFKPVRTLKFTPASDFSHYCYNPQLFSVWVGHGAVAEDERLVQLQDGFEGGADAGSGASH